MNFFEELTVKVKKGAKTAVKALHGGDFDKYVEVAKNDLYIPAKSFVPQLQSNVELLKSAGAPLALMTGSGSVVFAVFDNQKERDRLYKKIKPVFGDKAFKAKTL